MIETGVGRCFIRLVQKIPQKNLQMVNPPPLLGFNNRVKTRGSLLLNFSYIAHHFSNMALRSTFSYGKLLFYYFFDQILLYSKIFFFIPGYLPISPTV